MKINTKTHNKNMELLKRHFWRDFYLPQQPERWERKQFDLQQNFYFELLLLRECLLSEGISCTITTKGSVLRWDDHITDPQTINSMEEENGKGVSENHSLPATLTSKAIQKPL